MKLKEIYFKESGLSKIAPELSQTGGFSSAAVGGPILSEDDPTMTSNLVAKQMTGQDIKRTWNILELDKAFGYLGKENAYKEFYMGMFEEYKEHGTPDKSSGLNVVGDNLIKVAKIVLAHMKEDCQYYSKLNKIMK